MFKSIITCCTKKDIRVLVYTIKSIRKYISDCPIFVYVPDLEYDYFSARIIIQDVLIKKDSTQISSSELTSIKEALAKFKREKMTGWYIQQFIKIKSASQFAPNDAVLIWDSDTIPLRPINFINRDGSMNYFVNSEYHEPYFNTINDILHLSKQITPSFISQCFPLYSKFAVELINDLGGYDKWIYNIMKYLDISSDCAFSEYETLGTYIKYHHPEHVRIDWTPWERDGYKRLFWSKDIPDLIAKTSFHFPYIAIEKADRNKIKFIISKIKILIDRLMFK
jgi:hypothetical protein